MYEENGQIFTDFVFANNRQHAFTVSAHLEEREGAEYICSLDGHVSEGESIDYAGSTIVSNETILEQSDVFA